MDAASLNSGDCFCLYNEGTAYLWLGEGASESERKFLRSMAEGMKVVEMEEGSETEQWWELLGGKKEYSRVLVNNFYAYEPRLF